MTNLHGPAGADGHPAVLMTAVSDILSPKIIVAPNPSLNPLCGINMQSPRDLSAGRSPILREDYVRLPATGEGAVPAQSVEGTQSPGGALPKDTPVHFSSLGFVTGDHAALLRGLTLGRAAVRCGP